MKLTISLNLIFTLFLFSCKKENQSVTDTQLYGKWKWESNFSGSATTTPQNTGINETLVFNSNLTWSKTQNGVIVNNGTYKTANSKNSKGENIGSVTYNNTKNQSDTTTYYKVYNDTTLIFSHDFTGTIGSSSRTYNKSK